MKNENITLNKKDLISEIVYELSELTWDKDNPLSDWNILDETKAHRVFHILHNLLTMNIDYEYEIWLERYHDFLSLKKNDSELSDSPYYLSIEVEELFIKWFVK